MGWSSAGAGFKPAPTDPTAQESEADPRIKSGAAADDAAPADAQAPGEQTESAEPEAAAPPPIEPPRSWTKDEKERFQSLPRETQEYLATREQERDREFRRSQNEAAEKLKDNPNLRVEIEGHTDSVGTELYNLGLGQRRAEAVKGYLVLRHQVDSNRMTALSYGESRPIADNRTSEGRAQNRRVEFKVLIR